MPPYTVNDDVSRMIWKMWFLPEYDTLRKLQVKLTEMGIVSRLKKPYGRFAISRLAWRFACDNIEEAKDDFRKGYATRNVPFDAYAEENFYRKLIAAAVHYMHGKRLDDWIAKNDLEKYRKYIIYR